jgi:hypothetical protein
MAGARVSSGDGVSAGLGVEVGVRDGVGDGDEVRVEVMVGVACPQPASKTTIASNKPIDHKHFMKSLPLPIIVAFILKLEVLFTGYKCNIQ